MSVLTPGTIEEVQEIVRGQAPRARLRPVAGRSKTALSTENAGGVTLDVSALTGVIDYQPAECTFTARAATPVAEIEAMLAEHGQYLPFEPPFVDRGATIGGTVATALSGPGRLRYGGVRDFLLGVRFVDGNGRVVRGGGRVVKNAAGFYLQHLLLGSLGTLGVLTEVTCKVFPRAQAQATLAVECTSIAQAVDLLARLRRTAFELDAAELIPPGRLLVRVAGASAALDARLAKLSAWLQDAGARASGIVDADEAQRFWHEARELTWAPAELPLVKIATTLGRIARLDQLLTESGNPPRRYGAGGDITWLSWARPVADLDAMLIDLEMPGLVVLAGAASHARLSENSPAPLAHRSRSDAPIGPLLGLRPDAAFLQRVRQTLDPRGVFD